MNNKTIKKKEYLVNPFKVCSHHRPFEKIIKDSFFFFRQQLQLLGACIFGRVLTNQKPE
jgi:hypothetical protein